MAVTFRCLCLNVCILADGGFGFVVVVCLPWCCCGGFVILVLLGVMVL